MDDGLGWCRRINGYSSRIGGGVIVLCAAAISWVSGALTRQGVIRGLRCTDTPRQAGPGLGGGIGDDLSRDNRAIEGGLES